MSALSVYTVDGDSDLIKYDCCTICEKERSVEVEADFYCKKCLKYFCRKCIYSHRQHGRWFFKKVPYGKDKIMKWPLSKKMENSLLTCVMHKDEQLTMYCTYHSKLCCSECVELNHRLCLQVTPLPRAAIGKSTDLNNLSVRTQNTLSRMKQFQTYQEDRLKTLKVSYNQHEKLIVERMRLNIISFLLQCENSTVNETHKNVEYTVNKMRVEITSSLADFEKSTLKEKKTELTLKLDPIVRERNSCIRLYNQLFYLHVAIQKLQDRPEISFIAGIKCQEKLQQSDKYLQENCSNHVFTVNRKAVHNVRIYSDSGTCCITAICVMQNGQVLVADSGNMNVKLLDDHYYYERSQWGVPARPHDICQVTPSEVAVAVYDYRNIHAVQFITVTQSQLIPGRTFQLQHYCTGIEHHQGDMFISTGQALYKYSLGGKLVCRLYEDASDKLTVYKCAVSPTGDKLYITNYHQHKLLTLSSDGTLLFTFTDPELYNPSGLHVTPSGQVLVCGWLSHTILQMDYEGRRKLATLATKERDGMWAPESVCYSSTTSSIIVGQWENNNIMVFGTE